MYRISIVGGSRVGFSYSLPLIGTASGRDREREPSALDSNKSRAEPHRTRAKPESDAQTACFNDCVCDFGVEYLLTDDFQHMFYGKQYFIWLVKTGNRKAVNIK